MSAWRRLQPTGPFLEDYVKLLSLPFEQRTAVIEVLRDLDEGRVSSYPIPELGPNMHGINVPQTNVSFVIEFDDPLVWLHHVTIRTP